jgi:hypothetical protein
LCGRFARDARKGDQAERGSDDRPESHIQPFDPTFPAGPSLLNPAFPPRTRRLDTARPPGQRNDDEPSRFRLILRAAVAQASREWGLKVFAQAVKAVLDL